MDYKEAYEILHPDTTIQKLAEFEYYGGFAGRQKKIEAVNEACVVACEALEKQVKKKPVFHDNCGNRTVSSRCPKCFDLVSAPYCSYCGQALDWSD